MIHLIDVEKHFNTDVGVRQVLRETRLSIPTDKRVGVLGRNGAGKSTLLNMVAGVDQPSSGMIVRENARLSWPLGYAGGFHGDLTARENISFVARLYGVDYEKTFDLTEDFAEIGSYVDMPVRTYSGGMKSRLAFGLSLAIKFDCYLIDETIGAGDRFFRAKSRQVFLEQSKGAGMLLVSHSEATIREYCEIALVLFDGVLVPFADIEDAIDFYMRRCAP
ncbi:MAG: ABC transporter ATP-binding protein [Parvibaculum sp.]|uniref:ABC transporter ATP-binding protein n=1 Tax=Parvibaculum sp. TaxID=2024848 RepID=UPI0027172DD6|nr:ABC transporter ATP-binding protein [Parvibaculum sp.]MDO8838437.1 ABC transporter ATP-binding protein [Parvibaculum sp.]